MILYLSLHLECPSAPSLCGAGGIAQLLSNSYRWWSCRLEEKLLHQIQNKLNWSHSILNPPERNRKNFAAVKLRRLDACEVDKPWHGHTHSKTLPSLLRFLQSNFPPPPAEWPWTVCLSVLPLKMHPLPSLVFFSLFSHPSPFCARGQWWQRCWCRSRPSVIAVPRKPPPHPTSVPLASGRVHGVQIPGPQQACSKWCGITGASCCGWAHWEIFSCPRHSMVSRFRRGRCTLCIRPLSPSASLS